MRGTAWPRANFIATLSCSSARSGQPEQKTALGVRYNLVKDLPNGNRFVRHAACIIPNAFIIPDIRETGPKPKRQERGSQLSWAVPVDNEHVTGLSIVAWPLEDGAPK